MKVARNKERGVWSAVCGGITRAKRALRSKVVTGVLGALCLAPCATSAEPNFLTGTHIVKGMLKDVRNVVLPAKSQIRIEATDEAGHVIATTTVSDPTDNGYNFALFIPLSQTATDRTVKVGDKLNCVFKSDYGVSVATEPITVGEANGCSTFNFVFAKVTTITRDGKSVQVPDDYLAEMQAYLDTLPPFPNEPSKAYNPWGDYDNDGALNFAEYLAGTNPFDPSDRLRITSFALQGEGEAKRAAIGFEYVGGHLYGVLATPALVHPDWLTRKAALAANGMESEQVLPSADPDDAGMTVIYVTPTVDAKDEFFRLQAK